MNYSVLAAFTLAFLAFASCDDDMDKICGKATDEVKATAVLKCFKILPDSEDMKNWLECKKEVKKADTSCPKFVIELCTDEKLAKDFDQCTLKRFKPLTTEERKEIGDCIDKI